MRRLFFCFLCLLAFSFILCSCGTVVSSSPDEFKPGTPEYSMFVQLELNTELGYRIVYHRDTKVMYSISDGYNSHGIFTVLLNPDGSPMCYQN